MTDRILFNIDFMMTPNPGETFATWDGLVQGSRSEIHTGDTVTAAVGEVTHPATILREEPWGVVLAVDFSKRLERA
jgi:hypothetical protein